MVMTITIEGGVLVSMTEAEDLMKDKEEKMMEEEVEVVVEEVKEEASRRSKSSCRLTL